MSVPSTATRKFISIDETPHQRIEALLVLEGEVDGEVLFPEVTSKSGLDVSEKILEIGGEVARKLKSKFEEGARKTADGEFLQQTAKSGTTKDKIAALMKLVRQAPLLRTAELQLIVNSAKHGDSNTMKLAVEAAVSLYSELFLPEERELQFAEKHPLKVFLNKKSLRQHHTVPRETACMLIWWEDTVKRSYVGLLNILDDNAKSTITAVRKTSARLMGSLLVSHKEQQGALLDMLFQNAFNDPEADVFSEARSALHVFMKEDVQFGIILSFLRTNIFKPHVKLRGVTRSLNVIGSLNKSKRSPTIDLLTYEFYIRFMQAINTKPPKRTDASPDKKRNKYVAMRIKKRMRESGETAAINKVEKLSIIHQVQSNLGGISWNHLVILALSGFEGVLTRLQKEAAIDEERVKEDFKIVKRLFTKLNKSPTATIACISLLQRSYTKVTKVTRKIKKEKRKKEEVKQETEEQPIEDLLERVDGPFFDGILASAVRNPALLRARNRRILWRCFTSALACDPSPSRALEAWLTMTITCLNDYQPSMYLRACQSAKIAGKRQRSIGNNLEYFQSCKKLKVTPVDESKVSFLPVYWQAHLVGQHVDVPLAISSSKILTNASSKEELLKEGVCSLGRSAQFRLLSGLADIVDEKDSDFVSSPLDVLSIMKEGYAAAPVDPVKPSESHVARYYRDCHISTDVLEKLSLKQAKAAQPNDIDDEALLEAAYDEEIARWSKSKGGDDDFISDESMGVAGEEDESAELEAESFGIDSESELN
eukprot:GHVH01004702.1.p1 GENE.GHVH01004702.1~~GHVH01004702.1.p1  ORF type:complete len:767 (-),score=112.69 GHVH01004702.1:70-2370(-)